MSDFIKGFYNPLTHNIVRILQDDDMEVDQNEETLGVRALPWTKYTLGHDHAEDNLRELITRVNDITKELITDPACCRCNGTGWADKGTECSDCDGTGEVESWEDLYDYSLEDMVKLLMDGVVDKEQKYIAWLPVYLYDHSGITINTTGFSCGWDSGCIGIVYTSLFEDNDALPSKREGETLLETTKQILAGEIKYIDYIITGNVYRWEELAIDQDGDYYHDESCGGYVGDINYDDGELLAEMMGSTSCDTAWKDGKLTEIDDDEPENILTYAPSGETIQERLDKFLISTDDTTAGVMCTDGEGFYLFSRPLKIKQLLSLLAMLEKGDSRTMAIQIISDELRGEQ